MQENRMKERSITGNIQDGLKYRVLPYLKESGLKVSFYDL